MPGAHAAAAAAAAAAAKAQTDDAAADAAAAARPARPAAAAAAAAAATASLASTLPQRGLAAWARLPEVQVGLAALTAGNGGDAPSDSGEELEDARDQPNRKTYACELCPFTTDWKWSLDRHTRRHDKGGGQKKQVARELKQIWFASNRNSRSMRPDPVVGFAKVVNDGKRAQKIRRPDELQELGKRPHAHTQSEH